MNPEKTHCVEDEAIDAITLQCAGAVDDYTIHAVSGAITWDEAVVECADDGAELIIGAGPGFDFTAGVWDFYRCAETELHPSLVQPLPATMPDTAVATNGGIFGENFGGIVVIIALVALNFIGRRKER